MYDAIVLGSGQGGTPLAIALANAGRKTALVGKAHVGGCCINEGCTPTKTMVASARVAYLARRARDYGVHASSVAVDMMAVRQRKRDIVNSFRGGSESRLKATANLDLIMGHAKFVAAKELEVNGAGGSLEKIKAETIFINVGCRPARLDLSGPKGPQMLDSTSIMELDTVPENLVVVGGGYVGLEFAQMFRRFGSDVTVVHRGSQLLPREDTDIADEVKKILEQDGLNIMLRTSPFRISEDGKKLSVTVNGAEKHLSATHILAAAGRVPNTDILSVSASGV